MKFTFVCVVLYNFVLWTMAVEPECSRFHYEEKTLEKIIRLEFLMEKIQVETSASRDKIAADLAETQANVADDLSRFKTESLAMKSEVDKVLIKLHETKTEDKSIPRSVSFKARTISTPVPPTKTPIIFTKTMFDTNSSYDSTTGIFTIPVSGTYFFNLQVCVLEDYILKIEIMKDNIPYSMARLQNNDANVCHTADSVLIAQEGERVWVEFVSDGTRINQRDEDGWNTFSGVLISP